ncbi:MAG TPA: tripartite tricarboxylate transporter substrate binding protein [Burkholderiales bacterium]|nr:tripartite tricarboxylate transporter substrate binding protein [Burkholderiales bacterium]
MFSRSAAVFAVAVVSFGVSAQPYPDRPIRVVVGVPAGGTPDVMARSVTAGMSRLLGQPLVMDNRGGAGGLIGTEVAAKSAPDGYTLLVSSPGPLTILPHLQKHMTYDPLRDFVPVGLIASNPFLLITHPAVSAKSVKELIALARSQPGKLNYASAGNGAANHLAMELFKSMAGVNITHVPYKGAPQAVTDVLAGHMNMMFNSIPPVLAHIKADRFRALGVGNSKRSPQLPDVPTITEAGVPGYEAITWFGMLAPAKTPKAVLARINEAFAKVMAAPELRAQLEAQGAEPGSGSGAEFSALIRREYDRYAKVVKSSGAKID